MSKKSENEKKSITKSMKKSTDMAYKINENANKKDMNYNHYLTDCIIHNDSELTPELKSDIENEINKLVRLASYHKIGYLEIKLTNYENTYSDYKC